MQPEFSSFFSWNCFTMPGHFRVLSEMQGNRTHERMYFSEEVLRSAGVIVLAWQNLPPLPILLVHLGQLLLKRGQAPP